VAQHPFHLAFAVRDLESTRRFFLDPSENAIELKSFQNPAAVFTR
jgi:extradiol dioxygenase family protein